METRHLNALLRAMVYFHINLRLEIQSPELQFPYRGDGILEAEQLLEDMRLGKLGVRAPPDADSYNAIIEVLQAHCLAQVLTTSSAAP